MLSVKHLIDTTSLTEDDIYQILDTARAFEDVNNRAIKKVPALRGRTIVNLFLEPSTRTKSSFELAEKRLSADSLSMGGSTSSVVKGDVPGRHHPDDRRHERRHVRLPRQARGHPAEDHPSTPMLS